MPIKKSLYDKTTRFGPETMTALLTEKLDGSNLCFYVENGELFVAQRNWIFSLTEINEAITAKNKDIVNRLYKGLAEWLNENGEWLKNNIREGSIICGEWMGQGQLSYKNTDIDKFRYYMFAKANWSDTGTLTNFVYDPDYFHYAFESWQFPLFMRPVPVIKRIPLNEFGSEGTFLETLDKIYAEYKTEQEDRNVEGIVVSFSNLAGNRMKYVRMKNKKLEPHAYWGYNGKKVMK